MKVSENLFYVVQKQVKFFVYTYIYEFEFEFEYEYEFEFEYEYEFDINIIDRNSGCLYGFWSEKN